MDIDGKDPFGYSSSQYLWVVVIAGVSGLIKYINSAEKFRYGKLFIDLATACFTGVMTFWMCESLNIHGPTSALMIAAGGMMGNRAFREFESFWRSKFGLLRTKETDRQPLTSNQDLQHKPSVHNQGNPDASPEQSEIDEVKK